MYALKRFNYAKYVYNNIYCSCFSRSIKPIKKNYVQNLLIKFTPNVETSITFLLYYDFEIAINKSRDVQANGSVCLLTFLNFAIDA